MQSCRARVLFLSLLLSGKIFAGDLPPIQTVFVIVMENQNWAAIKASAYAAYIKNTLLPMSSYCEQYYNPPGLHPSEPNYLWLEAGTNFGILNNNFPSSNHQNTTNHLVTLLKKAGISWKTYQEDINGAYVPLTATNQYVPRHNPFVFFDDVTGTNNTSYPYGITHIRPYEELVGDLTNNTVARYNFITPNLCNDMHDCGISAGDAWLSREIPKIRNSQAYQNGGAIFIVWDEGPSGSDGPVGMIVLSPFARGGGYFNNIHYTHSSTVRTLQEIFGVTPLLGDAANATNLSDLFSKYSATSFAPLPDIGFRFTVTGVIPGKSNVIQFSTNLITWSSIATNVVATNNFSFTDATAISGEKGFYRVMQLP